MFEGSMRQDVRMSKDVCCIRTWQDCDVICKL